MISNSKTNMEQIVLNGVLSVVNSQHENSIWTGTMTDLQNQISKNLSRSERKNLPGSPAALRIVLNRIVNRIRNKRVGVKFYRTPGFARTRLVKFSVKG